ncbi:DUF6612 family protein [Sporosarcina sp. CAU 1771]
MRKQLLTLLLIGVLIVTACTKQNEEPNNESKKEPVSKEQETVAPDSEEPTLEVEEEEKKDEPITKTISGVKDVLDNTAEAMKSVETMTIDGVIITKTEMAGVSSTETTDVTGVISMSPFTQHVKMHSVSTLDPPEDSELYITEEVMYGLNTDDGGWISMPTDALSIQAGIFQSDEQFARFSSYHELLSLEETDTHYKVLFTGSDDVYKEVVLGVGSFGEAHENLMDIVKSISGTLTLLIDKKSFYVVGSSISDEQIAETMGIEIKSEDEISYTYSSFNDLERVVVPEDVINNAVEISLPNF